MRYAGEAYIPEGYTDDHKDEYDFALLVYHDTSPCYLQYGYKTNWPNSGFKIVGYPGDKRDQSCSGQAMFDSSCGESDTQGANRFKYYCDTSGIGNSGAPLISTDDKVYGVHTHSGSLANYGVRITKSRFCLLAKWMRNSQYSYTTMCGGKPCCPDASACFPPHGTVTVSKNNCESLEYVRNLRVGDKVLVVSAAGLPVYSPVIAILHSIRDISFRYVKIETENDEMFLTPTHLIFRQTNAGGSIANGEAVFASKIKRGNNVFLIGSNMSFIPERVNDVSYVDITGAYGRSPYGRRNHRC